MTLTYPDLENCSIKILNPISASSDLSPPPSPLSQECYDILNEQHRKNTNYDFSLEKSVVKKYQEMEKLKS